MLQFEDYGLYEVEAATGIPRWFLSWPPEKLGAWANVADPLVFDGKVFVSTGYGIGCALLDVSSGSPRMLWKNQNLCNDLSTSIHIAGYLFGCHEPQPFGGWDVAGTLRCLDIEDGELVWEVDLGAHVTLSAAGNKLLLLSERGMLSVAEVGPEGFKPISSFDLLQGKPRAGKFWTPPVLCNGRIYCRNYAGELICLDVGG